MKFVGLFKDKFSDLLEDDPCYGVEALDPISFDPGIPGIITTLAGTQHVQEGLPPDTVALWRAIATAFPQATALGAWGDRSHKARKSCHNTGHALDISTLDAKLHDAIVRWALLHRQQYGITLVISRRRKWSAKSGWTPRRYLGTSAHNDHVHLSVNC
jgi:hypothetical protein